MWPCIGSLCLQQLAESFELVSAWDLNSLAKTFWVQSQGNPINILWCNVCFHHKWLAWQIPTVTVTFGVLKGERMWDSIWHLACYKDLRKLPHGESEYTQCIWVVCSIKVWKTCKTGKVVSCDVGNGVRLRDEDSTMRILYKSMVCHVVEFIKWYNIITHWNTIMPSKNMETKK